MGIHALFSRRDQIHRTVTQIPGGVRATTEADDPSVGAQLREHVQSMYARFKEDRPIKFAAIFENADKIWNPRDAALQKRQTVDGAHTARPITRWSRRRASRRTGTSAGRG